MSQFDFPRLHFRGDFSADVGTANNDDFGDPAFVDTVHVRVDTLGMSDDDFAKWLRGDDPQFGIRAGWNLYGNGDCGFSNATCHAAEPKLGTLAAAAADDPVVGAAVKLLKAVMVDQDPKGTTSTQIFATEFRVEGPGGLRILGRPARACSRWVARRNLGVGGFEGFAAVWHSVVPPRLLTVDPGTSRVLLAFKAAKDAGNGLFIRYCTYLLSPRVPDQQLAADFAAGKKTVNPAIGKVLGTIGIWKPAEATTLAEGRRLNAGSPLTFNRMPFTLNPTTAQINAADRRVSVDFINTVPEADESLEKVNLGTLQLVLETDTAGGVRNTVLGPIPNTRAAYEARAGLVDLVVPEAVWPSVAGGRLKVVQQATGSPVLVETPVVIETDDRATYLQQGQQSNITLRAWLRGRPAAAQKVKIRQFATPNKTLDPVPPAAPVVQCPDTVVTDQNGTALVLVMATDPGCCTLRFTSPDNDDSTEYFACVRVLAADDYSHVPDGQVDFALVYREILQYYHLLHPAMDSVIDLSDENAVRARIDPIRARASATAWDNPAFMPRTRDLSAGKLALLLRWCAIVSPPPGP
jgi:hypothetical protein